MFIGLPGYVELEKKLMKGRTIQKAELSELLIIMRMGIVKGCLFMANLPDAALSQFLRPQLYTGVTILSTFVIDWYLSVILEMREVSFERTEASFRCPEVHFRCKGTSQQRRKCWQLPYLA